MAERSEKSNLQLQIKIRIQFFVAEKHSNLMAVKIGKLNIWIFLGKLDDPKIF